MCKYENQYAIAPISFTVSVAEKILKMNSPFYHSWTATGDYSEIAARLASNGSGVEWHTPLPSEFSGEPMFHYHPKKTDGSSFKSMSFYGLAFGNVWEPEDGHEWELDNKGGSKI